jgi:GMP synthase (glutamine-hydrolysing)
VAIENPERQVYGFQFHPEVMHTEHGMEMIKHFLIGIAHVPADWTMGQVLEEQLQKIAAQVGSSRTLIC